MREEVVVQRWEANEIEVLSVVPCRLAERLTLEVPGNSHRSVEVTVVESRPFVAGDGAIRQRVRLSIDPTCHAAGPQLGRQAL